jgi:PilZ domain-containing protein
VRAPACPSCGSGLVGRTHRKGIYERLASLAYVYPFRCQACQRRFRRFRWRERYVRVHLDRRDLDRVPCQIPVTFHWKNGGQGEGTVRDISAAGCAIETRVIVPVGALLLLQMSPEGGPPIDVDVGEARAQRGGFVGVRFVKIADTHAESLRGMILRLAAARHG